MSAKKTKLDLSMNDFDPTLTPPATTEPAVEVIVPAQEAAPKRRPAGRPKTKEPCTNINVAVPNRLLDQINEVVLGTKVDYITKLIEKDMEENYAKYKAIKDQLQSI